MRILPGALCAVLLASAAPAFADQIDLSTVTCKQLFEGPQDRIPLVLFWLDAYYRDEDSPPVIDFDKMKADAEKLGTYCAKNQSTGLITAADAVFEK